MTPLARVLIIDNDQRFIEHVREILSSQGVEVLCVTEPDQVAQTLSVGAHFDAIVADLSSPYFGSPQFCQNIVSRFPLVVVSATEDRNFLERYSSLCDCVLAKHSLAESLYKATLKAIERHHLGLQMVA